MADKKPLVKGEVVEVKGTETGGKRNPRRALAKRYNNGHNVIIGVGPTNKTQLRASAEFTPEAAEEFAEGIYILAEKAREARDGNEP